jgi:hypothetical protein
LLNLAHWDLPQPGASELAGGASSQQEANHSPTGQLRFHDYLLENVYLRTTRAERSEIIALWRDEDALDDHADAKRRSREAVFLVRNASGELAGVSTVGFVRIKDGRIFYNYRMFLRTRDRVPNLMTGVVLASREFLRTFQHPELQPDGLLHINENPKLMRPGARRVFERIGYRYWGKTSQDEDVWAMEFDQPVRDTNPPAKWRGLLKKLLRRPWRRQDDIPILDLA